MLIYLDARDLINLFEASSPCSPAEFGDLLRRGDHRLVLSMNLVLEVSQPLLKRSARTNVSALLNRIEAIPIRYIAETGVPPLELREALTAFNGKREFVQPDPFVGRFDETLKKLGEESPTRQFLSLELAETVFTLWRGDPSNFEPLREMAIRLREKFAADRASKDPPQLADHFVVAFQQTFLVTTISRILPTSVASPTLI